MTTNIITGKTAKGCEQCLKGEKLVLFVTGVCGNGCTYCPVSDEKNTHDVQYANETPIKDSEGLIEEALMMDAKGAGITGGDPLATLNRTCEYIRALKKAFGKKFHVHLYTPLLRVNNETLTRLHQAGLDEIRLHPKLHNKTEWKKIALVRAFNWDTGIEVPVLPSYEKEITELMAYAQDKVDFFNLNEFEYADNEVFEHSGKRYEAKNELSYGVKGSEEAAKRLIKYAKEHGIRANYCSAKSKDSVQLAKRLKRRSERAAKPYDAIDKEGLLTRGALYESISLLEVNPTKLIAALGPEEKKKRLQKLTLLKKRLIKEWDVPEELIELDKERLRLLTTTSVAQAAAQTLNMTVALVKEYPTADCFMVEAEVLSTWKSRSTPRKTRKKTSST